MTKKTIEPGVREPWLTVPSNELMKAKQAWEQGNQWGSVEALMICEGFQLPVPEWAVDALIEAVEWYIVSGKPATTGSHPKLKTPKADRKRFSCYVAVRQAMHEGKKGATKIDRAMEILKEQNLSVPFDTVEQYHKQVLSNLQTTVGQARYRRYISRMRRRVPRMLLSS